MRKKERTSLTINRPAGHTAHTQTGKEPQQAQRTHTQAGKEPQQAQRIHTQTGKEPQQAQRTHTQTGKEPQQAQSRRRHACVRGPAALGAARDAYYYGSMTPSVHLSTHASQ